MSATLYSPDGRVREIRPSNGVHWTPDELRSLVGGTPERLRTNDGRIMLVNDQHRLLGLELNFPATRIYVNGRKEVICGPAVVVDTKLELDGPDDEDEEED